MDKYWCILTTRYGKDFRDPSEPQLREALTELFIENHPTLTENDYAEHPDAWLRLGKDDGPLYVATITRDGLAVFEQWADADFETELKPAGCIGEVSIDEAFEIWSLLRRADIESVMKQQWAMA
jgi:hypothetical protein